MSDVTPGTLANPGQANLAGDAKALFLEIFSGEVMNAFNMATVTASRHTVRTISEGKSASFAATGQTTTGYHVPGAELTFDQIEHGQRIINIDRLLYASVFIDVLDEAMQHFDVRSEYSTQIGQALAETWDKDVLRTMLLAARSNSTLTASAPENHGEIITAAGAGGIAADYTLFVDALYQAARVLDEKNVPEGGRQAFVSPLTWYSLFRDNSVSAVSDMINRDFAGNGSIANVQMPKIAGVELIKTNNLPTTDESAAGNENSDLDIDYSDTIAALNIGAAVGTVKLLDLKMESQYDLRRQGNIILGKLAVGHGVLRPELALEINDAGVVAADALFTDTANKAPINLG
jgi:hypothetical protein